MASQGYYDWLAAGKPYALVRPAGALQAALRAHGLTVYDRPDEAHLKAEPPEDHTPYSATGWPGRNARWVARGLDVMPRNNTAAAAKENADIARQLIRDRNAGVPGVMWIKYLNYTDERGICRQVRWTPDYEVRYSGDKGHVHVSGRSDIDNDARADGYDPIARMNGVTAMTDWDTQVTLADGGKRPLWQVAVDIWNGIYQSGGEAAGQGVLTQGDYATRFPRSLSAQIEAIAGGALEQTDPAVSVTQEQVNAAVRVALVDPAVVAGLVKAINDDAARRQAE